MTGSSSELSRTGAAIASTPKDGAAALKGVSQYSANAAADTGLNSIATRATCGAISLSSSSHFPAIVCSETLKPVTLPPGREKLATKPLTTPSDNSAENVDMAREYRRPAALLHVVAVQMITGYRAASTSAQRRI